MIEVPIVVYRATILLKKSDIKTPKMISLVDENPINKGETLLASKIAGKAITLMPTAIEAIKMLNRR